MTNGEKFIEVFGISQVEEGELYAFAWPPNYDVAAEIPIDWWDAEYKAKGFLSKFNKIIKSIKPKTGHWIMTYDYYIGAYKTIDYVECSCCHEYSLEEGKFCPNCGRRMVKSRERSDKE